MIIRIRLFAGLKERVGNPLVELELPAGATIADARAEFARRYPAVEPLVRRALFASDLEYVTDATPLDEHAELACIPPVSGG